MKYIISYCSGGIGNRLLPLSSSFELSNKLSRELGLVWNKTDVCYSDFNNLFKNRFINFDLNELDPSEVSIYSNLEYIIGDFEMFKDSSLYNLYKKVGLKTLAQLDDVYLDPKKYIIIYDNKLFLNLVDCAGFFNVLQLENEIDLRINNFISLNNIDNTVFGIHARGTDFINEKLDTYLDSIEELIELDKSCTILFCSDSQKWENKVKEKFPNNVIIRKKNSHPKKNNFLKGWSNNIHRSEASVIEAIIDIYLLSKTNFVVYNSNSTFAQIALHLISMRKNMKA